MKKIAFVTYREIPDLYPDDQLAVSALARIGIETSAVLWDSPSVDWQAFDLVILRSCWEYHLRTNEFSNWIAQMEERRIPLWNSPRVVNWNIDKSYLKDLSANGVNIPPTVWIDDDSDLNLAGILEKMEWTEAVVKPTISMSAWQTSRVSLSTAAADEKAVREILKRSGVIVQKFIPEVQTSGEWSFVFFGETYSHAALKRPKAGDFRVQYELGGSQLSARPDPGLVNQARLIVDLIKDPLLYARVDAVDVDGELVLIELELIDPVLFFASDPHAPQRFADAVSGLL